MTDTGSGGFSLHPAWHAVAKRSSVAAGALVALIALYEHTPVWVAVVRGAITFTLVLLAARAGLKLLEGAIRADSRAAERTARDGRK